MEHFTDRLNQPTEVDPSILEDVEPHPIIEPLDDPITEEEIDTALKNTKLGKSPGPDGILLVHGGARLRALLLYLFNIFWTTEVFPSDLIDANITILVKKGDRSQCGNYKGYLTT